MKKIIFKAISLMLILALVLPMCVFSAGTPWDDGYYFQYPNGDVMEFAPVDGYMSMQNPPNFKWGKADNATSYQLIIAKDKELTEVVYSNTKVPNNYIVPDFTFETGTTYYWAVRCVSGAVVSTWSNVRKFKVLDGAVPFNVPSTEILLSRIPKTHPRIWTTKEELDEFRGLKDISVGSKSIYDMTLREAARYVEENVVRSEPEFTLNGSKPVLVEETKAEGSSNAYFNTDRGYVCGFAYLLTGNEIYADFAKRAFLEFNNWHIDGYSSPRNNVQITRTIAYKGASVYDWIYNTLSEQEKKDFLTMLKPRMEDITTSNEGIEKYPLNSMGWSAYRYLALSCIGVYGEMPEAETWLKRIFQGICTIYPNWSYQDGGWSQGTAYCWWSTQIANELTEVLAQLNIINLYETAWNKNAFKWNLYQMPYNSTGNFGDGAQQDNDFRWNMVFNNMHEIYFSDDEYNGYRKWIAEKAGGIPQLGFKRLDAYWLAPKYESVKAVKPTSLPLAHHFKDVGHVAMLSDIEDPNRIHFTLRGSSYGTAVHSMQEQNAFFISAFGKDLASKSGYYDYYQSDHHANITRQTFSKNTITVGDKGQIPDSFLAKAEILQFVNHLDFDSTTSNGTKAYVEDAFDNFERTVLYIRPDVFVVIDELDAKGDNKEKFSWWINSGSAITYDENDSNAHNRQALIKNDGANLSARVAYPATNGYYYEGFVNPFTGVVHEPTGRYTDMPKHNRKRFETAELDRTKMVVSMSVYKDGNSEKKPVVSYGPNNSYLKLSYLSGETTVLVNLNPKNVKVVAEAEGIEFIGTAVTYNADSIMLTDGTYLKKDGKEIVKNADKYITCAIGVGEICISSNSEFSAVLGDSSDYSVITQDSELTNEDGRKLSSKTGVVPSYNISDSTLTLKADKGDWTILTSKDSIVNPEQISASDVRFQKSADNKAAIFWNAKSDRTYDIKIDGGVIYNVKQSPYVFTINPTGKTENSVSSILIREKVGNHAGPWSKPVYISSYDDEVHGNVDLSLKQEGDITYINALTEGLPSYDIFDMYLASYNKEGKLISSSLATKDGNNYTAKIPFLNDGEHKAFIFGKELKPLSTVANYKADDTSLFALYLDGKPMAEYSDDIDYYNITIPHGKMVFPYVRALAKDNTSKTKVDYDFENMKASVNITSQSGKEREIIIKFKNSRENVHVVVDPSTGEVPKFIHDVDSYLAYDPMRDDRETNISKTNVVKVSFTRTVPGETSEAAPTVTNESLNGKIWTNFKENQGNYRYGSKIFADRWPGKGNYMELRDVPEDLKGYDYFVFNHDGFFADCRDKKHVLSNVKLNFTVNADSDVVLLSKGKADSLVKKGWTEEDISLQARFMNYPGPEDWYYNVILLGRDKNEMVSDPTAENNGMNYRLKNYTMAEEWVNVSAVSSVVEGIGNLNTTGYSVAVKAYMDAGLKKEDFLVLGNCLNYTTTQGYLYQYMYTKEVTKGDVSLPLDNIRGWGDECIIVIRPKTPKPYFEKNNFSIITEDDFDSVKEKLDWFSEAEHYKTCPPGLSIFTHREWLSNGTGVSLFNNYGTKMTWDVDVPETGNYSFVVKYVAWGADGLPIREVSFNDGKTYTFTVSQTESYGTAHEHWKACIVDADIFLEKGENLLTIKALNTGMWNIDWVGLMKN